MILALIYPCVGRYEGMKYLRAWQMEPLPSAMIAALTPADVEIKFYDDRMEDIPFDTECDLVAISVETYTARRSYQIASEFRKRGKPVVMGGFHATLCPDEVSEYADAVVQGPAEPVWEQVLTDFRAGKMQRRYAGDYNHGMKVKPNRSIYSGKDYVKITLLEAGRGCCFHCEFCSIQQFFEGKHYHRDIESILEEVRSLKNKNQLFFFVDDNITSSHSHAKALFRALIPLNIRWVGQADITITHDDELLELMVKSGCQGILTGFESLNPDNLKRMNKGFNQQQMTPKEAIRKIHKAGLFLYATFLYGYDSDVKEDYPEIIDFSIRSRFFMVGFNHVTPFPGTGLYERLQWERRLKYDCWWLDESYTYGTIPYQTLLPQDFIEKSCRSARKRFYSIPSILQRFFNAANIKSPMMVAAYFFINLILRNDATRRNHIPMGDAKYLGDLIKVKNMRTNEPSSRFRLFETDRSNEAALSEFYSGKTSDGHFHLNLDRSPDFFGSITVEGQSQLVGAVEDRTTGKLAGAGIRSKRCCFINGSVQDVGYISSFRVAEEYRKSRVMYMLFSHIRQMDQVKESPLYICSVLKSNAPAFRLFTSGKVGLPETELLGEFQTSIFKSRPLKRPAGSHLQLGLEFRQALPSDVTILVSFLQQEGAKQQFFPYYTEGDLKGETELLKGLKIEDISLVFAEGKLVGCLAFWNQTAFRHWKMERYSKAVQRSRLLINLFLWFLRLPELPPPGSCYDYRLLSLVCVRNNDPALFVSLYNFALNSLKSQSSLLISTGFFADNPLSKLLPKSRYLFKSHILKCYWPDVKKERVDLDGRPCHLEVGSL